MKTKRIGPFSEYILALIFFILGSQYLFPQLLSGNYTIGGNGPDYNALQEATNALVGNGVSGPVIYSMRPSL